MAQFTNRLDNVRVAAPCTANWDSMYGNERVRFCDQCQLNVYNLSEMSKAEAERLIGQAEGRLCVRYYKRRDGSVITQNCPVGLRAVKRRLSRIAVAISSISFSFLAGVGLDSLAGRFYLSRTVVGDLVVTGTIVPQERLPLVVPPMTPSPVDERAVVGRLVRITPQRIKPPRRSR